MSDRYTSLKHRSNFCLYPATEGVDPLTEAAKTVVEWVVVKEGSYGGSPVVDDLGDGRAFPTAWDYASPDDYRGGDYDADRWPALACASRRDEGGRVGAWAAEYDEPDSAYHDRRWHTTVFLQHEEDGSCRVSTESVCRVIEFYADPIPPTTAVPWVVRSLVDLPTCVARVGGTRLSSKLEVLTPQTINGFLDAVCDAERTLPLVLCCSGFNGKVPDQAKEAVRRLTGIANVYEVDWTSEMLRERTIAFFDRPSVPEELVPTRGSVHVYRRGIDLYDDRTLRAHDFWTYTQANEERPNKFADGIARRLLPPQRVPGIADLRD